MGRAALLLCQLLVAVVALSLWQLLATVPQDETPNPDYGTAKGRSLHPGYS